MTSGLQKVRVRFTLHKDNEEEEKQRNAGQIIRPDMPGREAPVVFIRAGSSCWVGERGEREK